MSNFIIQNCVVQGAIDGIYPDIQTTNRLIQNNLTSMNLKDGILVDADDVDIIQNNTSTNNGRNGIGAAQGSFFNTIEYNVMIGNAADGSFTNRWCISS